MESWHFTGEISLGTLLNISSMFTAVLVSLAVLKVSLKFMTDRLDKVETTLYKIGDRLDVHGTALSVIAVQKVEIDHLAKEIDELKGQFLRSAMFAPILPRPIP